MTKEERNLEILAMHNGSKSVREIAEKMNIGKSAVHKVLQSMLGVEPDVEVSQKDEVKMVSEKKTTAKKSDVVDVPGERFGSFVGWSRIGVNEYANDKSGEVIRVRFVSAIESGEASGYFVKV